MATSDDNASNAPRITDAEWKVMTAFWELGSGSLRDVVAHLSDDTEWKPRTVQSLVRRLTEKGALSTEAQGREFIYTPTVQQEQCQHHESRSFLGRVFDGQLVPFLAGFVERENLSAGEIADLRKLLDKATEDESSSSSPSSKPS